MEARATASVKNLLVSAACNTEYEAFAWCGEFVAFGACDQVHLCHAPSVKTLSAIRGHTGRVNNVKFLSNGAIVSACSDGLVLLLRNEAFQPAAAEAFLQAEARWADWSVAASLQLPNRNILQFSLLELGDHAVGAFLTTESDLHLVRIDLGSSALTPLDRLLFGNNLLEASAMFRFKESTYLFLSCSDFLVHVYRLEETQTPNPGQDGASLRFLNSLKGHEDKVKCLAAVVCTSGEEEVALVASGSKDTHIRIWRVSAAQTEDLSKEFAKKSIYRIGEHVCHLESNLSEHFDAISSVEWGFAGAAGSRREEQLLLLSSSFDFSVQVWQREAASQVWMNSVRLGQLGGNKNAFFGAKFGPGCRQLLACTFTGCFYLWRHAQSIRDWELLPTVTGHAREVKAIDWSANCPVLASASLDQTTRLFSCWSNPATGWRTWHEVSRAQVHGYDINAIKFLGMQHKLQGDSADRKLAELLVCGADEKVLRLLEPPAPFVNTVNLWTDSRLRLYFPTAEAEQAVLEDASKVVYKTKTEGGYSVLGLMVKAAPAQRVSYYASEEGEELEELENHFDIPFDHRSPPLEDYLFKHTLWPEINKLYGHGYELVSLDAAPGGRLIASSCKSQTAAHSAVFLWDPETCQVFQKLPGHNYTVLQVRFSSSGRLLAAVSRDRQTSLFARGEDGRYRSTFLATTHSKLIYSVAISQDEKLLATGSRDKTLKLFAVVEDSLAELRTHKFPDAVTSLEFGKHPLGQDQLLWVGLDDGQLEVHRVAPDGSLALLFRHERNWRHSRTVSAVRYGYRTADGAHVVASCSHDHSVRVFEYRFDQPAEELQNK